MKTDDLVTALSADNGPLGPAPQRLLWIALIGAFVTACAMFFALLGPRPDFVQAIGTIRFVFKFVVSAALAASAFFALRRVMRPETGDRPLHAALLIAPVLLFAAVLLEFSVIPSAYWVPRWFGQNWLHCLTFIPILSFMPLLVLLVVLRSAATIRPIRTGALAGLLAGAIGAIFYAAHCPDDSPLFVASWYTIAIAVVTGLGAFCGSRLLQW